jgi:hypothetical protein
LQGDLLTTWQALLLTKAQLTQTYGHLTTVDYVTKRQVDVVKNFLTLDSAEERVALNWRTARQLWEVMCTVFSASWLRSASEELLKVAFAQHDRSGAELTSNTWEELSLGLLMHSAPDSLGSLTGDVPLQRRIWLLLADKWLATPRSWQETVCFVALPIRYILPSVVREVGCSLCIWLFDL